MNPRSNGGGARKHLLKVGDRYGRWTVVSHASPARYPSDNGSRARVNVRCACGYERAIIASQLYATNHKKPDGISRGCGSHDCQLRCRIIDELHATLDRCLARVPLHADALRDAIDALARPDDGDFDDPDDTRKPAKTRRKQCE